MQYHWKLLKSPYKYTKTFILLTAQKKTAIAMAANMKKKHILQKTKLKYTYLKCRFVALLIEPLLFCVFDY